MFYSLIGRIILSVSIIGAAVAFAGRCLGNSPASPANAALSHSPGGADLAVAVLLVVGLLMLILRPRKKQSVPVENARPK